jgi:hypothetical protein
MINIAVLINGSGKYLDLIDPLFNTWNNLYPDVKFDFYLATWEDHIDYSQFDWVESYTRLKEEDCPYDLKNHAYRCHQPHYSYTLFKANELLTKDYDAVLQTRSDFFLFKELLDELILLFKENQIGDNIIYSYTGSSLHNGKLWTDDMFFFGNQNTFSKFSQMFEDLYIKNSFTEDQLLMHIMQAEYLNYRNIYNRSTWSGGRAQIAQGLLIREPMRFEPDGAHTDAGWPTKHPSPIQFKNILNEFGAEWLLNKGNSDKARVIFETTDKE